MALGASIRRQKVEKKKIKTQMTRTVALVLFEDTSIKNTGILETSSAIIEYDILVWNEEGVIFEKKGKTSTEKLEDTLTFDAVLNNTYNISLDLTVVINGQRFPFFPVSPYDKVLNHIESETGIVSQVKSSIYIKDPNEKVTDDMIKLDIDFFKASAEYAAFIKKYLTDNPIPDSASTEEQQAAYEAAEKALIDVEFQKYKNAREAVELTTIAEEYNREGHIDIPFYVLNQTVIDNLIIDNFTNGKLPIILDDVIIEVSYLETQAKALKKQIDLAKKQALGSLYATEEETYILDDLNNENLYIDLLNLVASYKDTGLSNLSEYRLSVYETLKAATDNLIVLKGKLENINNLSAIESKKRATAKIAQ